MPIDTLMVFLLPAIFLLGIMTSYEDIRMEKIRNNWIIFALAYSFAAFLIVAAFFDPQNQIITENYFLLYFSNIIFALLAGIIIWIANLWSAGDAKLFLAYAALIPLSLYQSNSLDYFPSFAVIINTFIPFLVYYLLKTIFETSFKLKIKLLKAVSKPKFLLNSALFIFAFSWLASLILPLTGKNLSLVNNIFATILFLFLVLFAFRKLFKTDYNKISIVLAITAILFDYERLFSVEFLQYFIAIFSLFIFIRHFILNLTFEVFSYPIYIENLKPGMAVAENYLVEKGRYKKRRIAPMSFLSALMDKSDGKFLLSNFSEGLTKEDVKRIKTLHSQGKIKSHIIRIFQTVPFAPFMFFGVILTLSLKGSLFLL